MTSANAEASYPLSPMQQGMVFHSAFAASSGVDIEQMICLLREPIDVPAFRRAWQRVAARHAILRTSFRFQDIDEPVQEVHRTVEVPFEEHDLRGRPPEGHEAIVSAYLDADRSRGFDLSAPPLLRVALFRRADAEWTMVWTFSHALLDGRSFPIVLDELFAFHNAFAKNEDVAPALPRPYRDYIDWLGTLDASAAKSFWTTYLGGLSAPTPLPGARRAGALGAGGDGSHAEQEIHISKEDTSVLHAFARENGLTLNTLVQGAWVILLARHSQEADIVFGATRACRRSALGGQGTDAMVGIFINTVPVRVAVPGDASVLAWLTGLRANWRSLHDWEHTPLVEIQKASDLPPNTPLFETILVFEDYLLDTSMRARGGGWDKREIRIAERTNFPLTLAGYGGSEILLRIEYDRRRVDDDAVARMLGELPVVLAGMARGPQLRLSELPILPTEERTKLLVEWNDTKVDFPRDVRLHELVEQQVDRTPDAVAVVFEGATKTYRELDREANRIAHYLQSCGVGPDVLVGVAMDRSLELVAALLGVLKAGGAYVPIDPAYPADRVAAMVEDSRPPVILTQERFAARFAAFGGKTVSLDAQPSPIASQPDDRPRCDVTAEHLAYVLFTSGSTGRPKGVMIPHRAITNHMLWMRREWPLGADDAVLQKTPVSFDASVWEFYAPLMGGGRLVMARPGGHRETEYMVEAIRDNHVTVLQLVPSVFELLVTEPMLDACVRLRLMYCGGEALGRAAVSRFLERRPSATVVNLYGPTETAIDATFWASTPLPLPGLSAEPIGRPVANMKALILDRSMALVPIGASGELHLGGAGVGRGYLNRPDLTRERFVPNPFGDDAHPVLYKTGDVARYLPDGTIEYLGRADHQVKVRGFRIELGEIESVLGDHPGVGDAVVVAREDTPGDKRLVAYVVPKHVDAGALASDDLRAFALGKLPEFMVPTAFVVLERLPLAPNGKLDRMALPAPDVRAFVAKERVKPASQLEETLAGLFASVLKLPEGTVGATDDFFALGGHSILALRLVSQVQARLGKKLPLAALFQAPTPRELASVLGKAKASTALVIVTPANGSKKRPLFWCGQSYEEVVRFAKHLGPDQPLYALESAFYGITDPATHIKKLAARYVEEIVAVQPKGPYLLGGFCIDAFVAFDIAQHLEARGEAIGFLALVERDGPDPLYRRYQKIMDPLRYHLRNVAELGWAGRAGYVADNVRRVVGPQMSQSSQSGENGTPEPSAAAAAAGELTAAQMSKIARIARFSWLPERPYAGPVTLIQCAETNGAIPSFPFSKCGWEKTMTGPVEIHVVPGDHDSMGLEPVIGLVAAKVRARLGELG